MDPSRSCHPYTALGGDRMGDPHSPARFHLAGILTGVGWLAPDLFGYAAADRRLSAVLKGQLVV